MTPNSSEVDTTSGQQQHDASLHQAAWPDMLSSLHVAYGDLTRTQRELERRMAEIDETRELFERVIESMSEALFLMDVTGRIIRANRAAGALLECELATLIGKLFIHICQTADVPATPWRLLERAPNGVLTDIDVELRSHSRRDIPVSLSCVLVRDRQGMDEALAINFASLERHHIEVIREYAEIPLIVLDRHPVLQILVNLISNAKYAMLELPDRPHRLTLGVGMPAGREGFVRLQVQDTGVGINPEHLSRIFAQGFTTKNDGHGLAFTQADGSLTRKYGGTGLGLTISKQLVEIMGGSIWVESAMSQGSTFHFTVRFKVQPPTVVQPSRADLSSVRGLRVLIVDDNATYRRILTESLEHWQMQPVAVACSQKALTILGEGRQAHELFRLVLLDAVMPGMDGFALAELIKQRPELAEATIMMLTAGGHRGDAARCRELGIASYLTKPIKPSELLDAILTVFDTSSQKNEPSAPVTRHSLRESRERRHILLAEDNVVNQKLLVRLLENRGHTVVVAANGREALRALEREQFDMLLMDVQMPEMDGVATTASIRHKERQTIMRLPIIAMTAHAMRGDRERCLQAGMDGYISKPIRADELVAVVEGMLPATAWQDIGESTEIQAVAVFDRSVALSYVDGDLGLLQEMAETFLADYPPRLAELQVAIATGDSQALMRAAHSLKGGVASFAAKPTYEAALRLEMMGHSGDLSQARDAYAALDAELARLIGFLARLGRGSDGRMATA